MANDWSSQEVAATVSDYLGMLELELRGVPYNKAEHNRNLRQLLNNRSQQSVEFKHANISAVLIELGFPYINGYKPRGNYQDLLMREVSVRLDADTSLPRTTAEIVDAAPDTSQELSVAANVIVPAPIRERKQLYERRNRPPIVRRDVNYLEIEARNAALGRAGEEFVMNVEHRRLWDGGHRELANRIEHVSRTQGDGLGYDIVSYEASGKERLIEVKTTNFGEMTPFFATQREVQVSEDRSDLFQLYRVFRFRDEPKIFLLPGSLRQSVQLDATQYRASLWERGE